LTSSESARAKLQSNVTHLLDALMKVGVRFGLRFIISELDLSHTDASLRSIFGGVDGYNHIIKREQEIETLDLSRTKTSSRSLVNFCKTDHLRVLILDDCYSVRRTKDKAESNAFSLLADYPIQSLEVLSVVGTSTILNSQRWIDQVEKGCPKLKTLYFTRKPSEKALGWDDIIRMQSMRDPQLLPCGHVCDMGVLKQLMTPNCPIGREHFELNKLEKLAPRITKLTKENGHWIADIVDHNRQPLDPKVLYHTDCGEFYNLKTLINKYHVTTDNINQQTKAELHGKSCFACYNKFAPGKLRLCYPESAKLDEKHEFNSLSTVGAYAFTGQNS